MKRRNYYGRYYNYLEVRDEYNTNAHLNHLK